MLCYPATVLPIKKPTLEQTPPPFVAGFLDAEDGSTTELPKPDPEEPWEAIPNGSQPILDDSGQEPEDPWATTPTPTPIETTTQSANVTGFTNGTDLTPDDDGTTPVPNKYIKV